MKFLKYLISIVIIITLFSFLFSLPSCHKRVDLDVKYDSLMRVVGSEGGIINYFEYNPEDSISVVAVKVEVPENSLDSFVVFNMHEFEDEALNVDMAYAGMEQYSDFLYFVPFYKSYGYNEQTNDSIDYHLSIDFNIPAKVTYNLSFYEIPDNAKLYRIKIPKINEWGTEDNIWVNWNYQGYPNGYDALDLKYIISGKWNEYDAWGSGEISLVNWEEVLGFNYDFANKSVSFYIDNTDYLYVMATSEFKK